ADRVERPDHHVAVDLLADQPAARVVSIAALGPRRGQHARELLLASPLVREPLERLSLIVVVAGQHPGAGSPGVVVGPTDLDAVGEVQRAQQPERVVGEADVGSLTVLGRGPETQPLRPPDRVAADQHPSAERAGRLHALAGLVVARLDRVAVEPLDLDQPVAVALELDPGVLVLGHAQQPGRIVGHADEGVVGVADLDEAPDRIVAALANATAGQPGLDLATGTVADVGPGAAVEVTLGADPTGPVERDLEALAELVDDRDQPALAVVLEALLDAGLDPRGDPVVLQVAKPELADAVADLEQVALGIVDQPLLVAGRVAGHDHPTLEIAGELRDRPGRVMDGDQPAESIVVVLLVVAVGQADRTQLRVLVVVERGSPARALLDRDQQPPLPASCDASAGRRDRLQQPIAGSVVPAPLAASSVAHRDPLVAEVAHRGDPTVGGDDLDQVAASVVALAMLGAERIDAEQLAAGLGIVLVLADLAERIGDRDDLVALVVLVDGGLAAAVLDEGLAVAGVIVDRVIV